MTPSVTCKLNSVILQKLHILSTVDQSLSNLIVQKTQS